MPKSVCIIGGGIVGLATGYKLLSLNPDLSLILVEKETELASHQTGHNSGVIHSGLYYKPGSLKAQNCISGYNQLVDFCEKEDIPFELCGKIVVATSQQEVSYLDKLFERGQANGLSNLKKLKKEELFEYEPHVSGVAGIHVPQTGIIDYKQVALKYAEKIVQMNAQISLDEKVVDLKFDKNTSVQTNKREQEFDLIINCAGLYSDKVALMSDQDLALRIIPFRGEYYQLRQEKENLVKNLIYPVPDPNFPFLGVHFTRMIGGGIEAGPNAVLAFMREAYSKTNISFGELREILMWPGFRKVAAKYWKTGLGELYRSFSKSAFTRALQKLIPEIRENDLVTGGAGVRAQACDRTGGLLDDFSIIVNKNCIHVCNAPSPAATSSLAIGETVAQQAITLL